MIGIAVAVVIALPILAGWWATRKQVERPEYKDL